MALKTLMLRRKIDLKNKELEALREKAEAFATREAELEAAIGEAETEEEQAAVEEEIETFTAERSENDAAIQAIEEEVAEMERELAKEEEAQNTDPAKQPEERKDENMVVPEKRTRFGIDNAFVERNKDFITEIRSCIREKRALTNVGLTIPQEFLGVLRESLPEYSKLYKYVNVRRIGGEGRMVVAGTVPEAVWTECCANLNDLDLGFSDVEVDCNKLGGYFAICNAELEDSDIDLAELLIETLAQAIGLALDKAILYGTGTKMPLGVVTRLVQSAEPGDYSPTARPWADLTSSNVITIASGTEDAALIKEIIEASGAIGTEYARGEKVWVMNEKTYATLMANAITVNAAGAIVSGVERKMPVIGGTIETLGFIPDDIIIGGFFALYLLAERAGIQIGRSEHVYFLEDATAFKATARYDGQPAIAEAFVAIGLNDEVPDDTMTFASDTAN